ncbi:MAG: hypothetical protein AAB360_02795 [Patescibacteria group bacterium]
MRRVVLAAAIFSFVGLAAFGQIKFIIEILAPGKRPNNVINRNKQSGINDENTNLMKVVLPAGGVEAPIKWEDLGKQLVGNGVINQAKLENLHRERGEFDEEAKRLIESTVNDPITVTESSAGVILNLLWAFGLANKNPILENGQMADPRYGGVEKFASTGGWNLARGNAMDHYSKYEFVKLTTEQQALVEKISSNIYRPCCDNPTDFPDCNHGMAMLGLLELMAANGVGEDQMYKVALQVNSYWFPGYYPVIAEYFKTQGTDWDKVDPKEVLSKKYSSASGYKRIEAKISPSNNGRGSSCGT